MKRYVRDFISAVWPALLLVIICAAWLQDTRASGLSLGNTVIPQGYEVNETNFLLRGGVTQPSDLVDAKYSPNGGQKHQVGLVAKFHGQPKPGLLEELGGTEGERLGKNGIQHFQRTVQTDWYSLTGIDGETIRYAPGTGSFAELSANNGIGVYTHTGPLQNGELATFQVKRYSSNPEDLGIYVHSYTAPAALRVFDGPTATLRVKSRQQVQTANLPDGSRGIQKMAFKLTNSRAGACRFIGSTSACVARIAYSPNTFNSRTTNGTTLQIDPDQGGHAFVGGNLLGHGQPTVVRTRGKNTVVHTTYGNSTQQDIFGPLDFRIDITWWNFKDTLRAVTFKAGLDGNKLSDVQSIFGKGCFTRTNWILKDVSFGQEIHNANWLNETASMGGRVKRTSVEAL